MKRHVRTNPILAEGYLRKEMFKANRTHTDDKCNKLIDNFVILNQHEHLDDIGTDGEDIS